MQIVVKNIEELSKVVEAIQPLFDTHKIFAFDAAMGSGKTTFISKLISSFSQDAEVSSPTFGYVKEHETDLQDLLGLDVYL